MIATAVKTLADRYDPSASDPPLEARVRLAAGDEAHDVILDAAGARVVDANGAHPDALLSGYATAWRRARRRRQHGEAGLWSRLGGIQRDSLFVWGLRDRLVPIAFMKHVAQAFPAAQHLELDCGHVPQVERPVETHDAMRAFLA